MKHQTEGKRCLNLGCWHRLEASCHKRCESEEQVAKQIMWLRRSHWQQKNRWMAKQLSMSPGLIEYLQHDD
jgi:hypothetical protein